ncbi:MAG: hypothetical protein GKR89_32290 [Candidatus Latescibacteria bacterium]|nr:hypothetical protein [Candidatus Latescibacterota bacterium]
MFLSGSAVLVKKGFDFNQDADDFYDLYKKANDPDEAARFYSRTTNRDVKSQVSWALGAAFAISGARLLFFQDKSSFNGESHSLNLPGAGNMRLNAEIDSDKLGLALKKIWKF